MQRIFFITLITFLTVFSANAQKGFYFGAYGVIQNSWLLNPSDSDNPGIEYLPTVTPSAGIEGGYKMLSYLGLGMELNYSKQGQRYRTNDYERHTDLSYIKVPLLAVFNTNPEDSRIKYISKLGPELVYLTQARILDSERNVLRGDADDRFERLQFGAVFALGAGYDLTDNLVLSSYLRLDFGITDAERTEWKEKNPQRPTTNNTTVGLEVGVRYNIN